MPWVSPHPAPCALTSLAPHDGIGHSTVSQPHPRLPQQQDARALVAAVPVVVEGASQPLSPSCSKVGHWLVS